MPYGGKKDAAFTEKILTILLPANYLYGYAKRAG